MPDAVRPVPDEFGSIVVQLTVKDVDAAVRFYTAAFGADELFRNRQPGDPRVFHCELLVGKSRVMLNEEFRERGLPTPPTLGGTPVTIHLYVPDAEATFAAALLAGASAISEAQLRFWGVISGVLQDPFGHRWVISTRVEDLGPEEVIERSSAVSANDRLPVGKPGIHH
jgi:PhnB protein